MRTAPVMIQVAVRHSLALVAIFAATSCAGFAQSPAQKAEPASPERAANSVIRIDVNLVQVDAVVTDSRGRRVTNLPATAFEILQDGKPQTIANFTYVAAQPADVAAAKTVPSKPVKGEPPEPVQMPQPGDVRRTLALIVDDLGLAAETTPAVKGAIKNFLDNQMRPGDLVAIIRVSAGMGALQQFTSDKRLLYAALDRVKYDTNSRVGVSSFAPIGRNPRGTGAINQLREDSLAVGSLGAIQYVVNSMRGFPGRKSVILFTENVRMISRGSVDVMTEPAVRALADAANRAAVVIHAIDPRGIEDYNITPADDTSRMSGRRRRAVPQQREAEEIQTEEGMFDLAQETGGLFLHGTNDLAGALKKVSEDGDGYYLIGYHPDSNTFDHANGQPKFHRIEVNVKGSGLQVRSRNGFFGEPGADAPRDRTREAELIHALQSPFTAGAIHPALTAVFSNQPATGSSIDALLYFNVKELKWSVEADGSHKALIDIAAAAFDENGLALAPLDTTVTLQLPQAKYDDVLKKGMLYGIHVPVKKPGPYLVRAALRDPATEGSGSAQQFIEVPDVETGHLALTGIVFLEAALAGTAAPPSLGASENTRGGAARRTFHRGAALIYGYEIINAKADSGQKPELEVETRMFRDGEKVMDDKSPLPAAGAAESRHLRTEGHLTLGDDLKPGAYVLQVIVTDKLAKGKFGSAIQSTDFEIEP